MRAKERQSWIAKNVGKGGQRPFLDPFNKAKKGFERNPTADEYPMKDVDEYHRYDREKDLTKEDEDKKEESQQSKK